MLFGALVGGPDGNDRYTDSRNSITNNKVACDYNAGFQGAIAGMFISEIDIWCINGLWGLTLPHLFACLKPAHVMSWLQKNENITRTEFLIENKEN